VVGDLQRTSRAERWRESNVGERERIVRQVASERPDFLVLLGDLVFRGSSRRDWREFESLMAPIREAGIPVLPILGNHDYWISRRAALANYFGCFPHLTGRRWYSAAYGPLGLVFLDSNRRFLSALRWREQVAWYECELERFENDRAVRGVLVFVHHPPYTNSTITSDEAHVQSFFVPAFQRASKTLAMLSGHVHSYERFARGGKTFLVAGGGGGPRARLATGRRQAGGAARGIPLAQARPRARPGGSARALGVQPPRDLEPESQGCRLRSGVSRRDARGAPRFRAR
jgi:Icc-related predicted phosphoesterase